MASPFPGMDPFLEDDSRWPWFQHQLAIVLQQMLSAQLTDRYEVQISQRLVCALHHEQCQEYIEIRTTADGRLVTRLDIVSPIDKLTEAGRVACKAARKSARASGASIVDIDLLLRGETMLESSGEGLPHWDYAVTVTRGTIADRYEIYTSMLDKRLPRFRLPLASDDRDTVLDLQDAFVRVYKACDFRSRIDYDSAPTVPFSSEVLGRISDVLRQQKT